MSNVHQLESDDLFQSVGQVAAKVVAAADPLAYWKRALEIGEGKQISRDRAKELGATTEPQAGYYRKRVKNGKDLPVAIWRLEGSQVADGPVETRDGRTLGAGDMVAMVGQDPQSADDTWTWCFAWPISYELYQAVANHGDPWPEEPPAAEPAIGHNMPDDPHEAAKVEFDGERETAERFLKAKITTQQQADQAAVWAKKLTELFGRVDKMFRAKKDPIVQAGRKVDEEFRWREDVKALATRLKRAQDGFLLEQERLEKERQRKAREEAERLQREAEEAARKVVEEGRRKSAAEQEAARQEAERLAHKAAMAEREAEQQRKVQAGRTGAKTSLRTYYVGKIVDYDKAVKALSTHPEMKELVQKLADRAAKAGIPVDGIERVEERRAA